MLFVLRPGHMACSLREAQRRPVPREWVSACVLRPFCGVLRVEMYGCG